jgi:hydroxypyruvate isomerase
MVRFSINVSILFRERPFLKRFAAAHEAGFDTVELFESAIEAAEVDVAVPILDDAVMGTACQEDEHCGYQNQKLLAVLAKRV